MTTHWIIDVASVPVAGRIVHVAAIVDAQTKVIVATAIDIRAGRALGDAFRIAVGTHGVPGSLTVDNGKDYAVVVAEAAKMGVEVEIIQPWDPSRAFSLCADDARQWISLPGKGRPA